MVPVPVLLSTVLADDDTMHDAGSPELWFLFDVDHGDLASASLRKIDFESIHRIKYNINYLLHEEIEKEIYEKENHLLPRPTRHEPIEERRKQLGSCSHQTRRQFLVYHNGKNTNWALMPWSCHHLIQKSLPHVSQLLCCQFANIHPNLLHAPFCIVIKLT